MFTRVTWMHEGLDVLTGKKGKLFAFLMKIPVDRESRREHNAGVKV